MLLSVLRRWLIYCFLYLPLFIVVLCWSLFIYVLLYVLSSFAIILKRKRELVALFSLSFGCLFTVNALWRYLMVPWVGLHCVIVVFPDLAHLLLVFKSTLKTLSLFFNCLHSCKFNSWSNFTNDQLQWVIYDFWCRMVIDLYGYVSTI